MIRAATSVTGSDWHRSRAGDASLSSAIGIGLAVVKVWHPRERRHYLNPCVICKLLAEFHDRRLKIHL